EPHFFEELVSGAMGDESIRHGEMGQRLIRGTLLRQGLADGTSEAAVDYVLFHRDEYGVSLPQLPEQIAIQRLHEAAIHQSHPAAGALQNSGGLLAGFRRGS